MFTSLEFGHFLAIFGIGFEAAWGQKVCLLASCLKNFLVGQIAKLVTRLLLQLGSKRFKRKGIKKCTRKQGHEKVYRKTKKAENYQLRKYYLQGEK